MLSEAKLNIHFYSSVFGIDNGGIKKHHKPLKMMSWFCVGVWEEMIRNGVLLSVWQEI